MNVNEKIDYIVKEIQSFMKCNNGQKAIIGISGGKDSTVTAALCVKALGKINVIGVLMPNGVQYDIQDSIDICNYLGIKYLRINIYDAYNSITDYIENELQRLCNLNHITKQTKINLAPRLRMSVLYGVAQSIDGGRVMNTTNACEAFVGYGTLWGDTVGDYAPLKYLTVDEVLEIGDALGLPFKLVHKTPSDGLTGKSDEEILGVSYEDIGKFYKMYRDYGSKYTLINIKDQMKEETYEKIIKLFNKSQFKREMINVPTWKNDKYFTTL